MRLGHRWEGVVGAGAQGLRRVGFCRQEPWGSLLLPAPLRGSELLGLASVGRRSHQPCAPGPTGRGEGPGQGRHLPAWLAQQSMARASRARSTGGLMAAGGCWAAGAAAHDSSLYTLWAVPREGALGRSAGGSQGTMPRLFGGHPPRLCRPNPKGCCGCGCGGRVGRPLGAGAEVGCNYTASPCSSPLCHPQPCRSSGGTCRASPEAGPRLGSVAVAVPGQALVHLQPLWLGVAYRPPCSPPLPSPMTGD